MSSSADTSSRMFAALAAHAQTTGTISGRATDKAGAVIPKVQVSARNTSSGDVRTTTTNNDGEYSFPSLAPGDYAITFAIPGFSTIVETATLNVTEHIAVNSTMPVSNVNETIEVSATQPLLQTEDTTEGSIISGQDVAELPLSTNNFTQLLALSPGVLSPLNDATGLGRGTQNVNVNGARTSSNSVYVDGIDAVNVHTNSSANNNFASNSVVIPPPDAIQQIKISTALFDATTGRSGGSNTALITRSGARDWHGGRLRVLPQHHLQRQQLFLERRRPGAPRAQPEPVRRIPRRTDLSRQAVLLFQLSGHASDQRLQRSHLARHSQHPHRPLTPFARCIRQLTRQNLLHRWPTIAVDGSNISPVAVSLLQLKFPNGQYVIPSPNSTATTGPNFVKSTPSTFNEDEYTGSVSYRISPKDLVAVHAIIAEQPQFHAIFSSRFLPGFGLDQLFKSRLYSIAETHIFSPHVVNEFHFGVNRTLGKTGFQNQLPLASIGMTRFNSGDFPDIPEFMFSNSMEFGYTVSTDQKDTENTWQYFDNVSWLKGKHNMNFGFEMRRYQDNYYSNNGMRGTLDFISFQNFMLGLSGASAAQGGNGTGHSDIYEQTVASGLVQRNDRIRDAAFFVQDSWKPTPRVTFNLGLRWEYIGLPTDVKRS